LSPDGVRLQAASALDVVIHVDRTSRGREVACIGVMEDVPEGLRVLSALEVAEGLAVPGPAWEALAGRLGLELESL
jgi:pilus assembly protein CpaF